MTGRRIALGSRRTGLLPAIPGLPFDAILRLGVGSGDERIAVSSIASSESVGRVGHGISPDSSVGVALLGGTPRSGMREVG